MAYGSVRDSVWYSVGNSVWKSVECDVKDAIGAYVGSLFPCITDWHGVNNASGKYLFTSGAELWRRGLVPSFDGTTWRLHAGPDGKVTWKEGD